MQNMICFILMIFFLNLFSLFNCTDWLASWTLVRIMKKSYLFVTNYHRIMFLPVWCSKDWKFCYFWLICLLKIFSFSSQDILWADLLCNSFKLSDFLIINSILLVSWKIVRACLLSYQHFFSFCLDLFYLIDIIQYLSN